ncbi:hypothetical protein TYRP_006761 [Tyrophagus putrescentiae]|nr:hypothetical protein TYRP_006761 [Tyrophagus putrescentiae]
MKKKEITDDTEEAFSSFSSSSFSSVDDAFSSFSPVSSFSSVEDAFSSSSSFSVSSAEGAFSCPSAENHLRRSHFHDSHLLHFLCEMERLGLGLGEGQSLHGDALTRRKHDSCSESC